MGDFQVHKIQNLVERKIMYRHALEDIKTFERMLEGDMFTQDPICIGAEQELCIVNPDYAPAPLALKLLDDINDEHYTNELALFNLEINLDPLPLKNNCFTGMETSLLNLLDKGKRKAAEWNAQLLMTGILPTLKYRHLQFDFMTPIKRYRTISQTLSEIRGDKFEIYLQGVDEIIMSLGSVLFEACNTSFQLHLQIPPQDFVNQHNWSQMIAGPVLSSCVNSPLLFGKELWAESRIALFKQSLDTRSSKKFLRKKLPRVYFGNDWIQTSPAELWKNDLMRFPLIVTSDDFQDSKAMLENGEIPNLRAIRLHNGTTYTWNRLCYGPTKPRPHLRIECRYLPAGPTAIDEIANFAFWVGLMKSEPEGGFEFWKNHDFKVAKNNFIKAARTGLSSVFYWYGKKIAAKDLILDHLLPMARTGLLQANVSVDDVEKYLSIIEKRVRKEKTPAEWAVQNFRTLSKRYGATIAEKEIVKRSLDYQIENLPLHEWQNIKVNTYAVPVYGKTVEQKMTRDIISIPQNGSIDLAKSMMEWNNIHHLPVENDNGDLVGLLTDGILERFAGIENPETNYAMDLMIHNPVTIQADSSIQKAKELMTNHHLGGLPVVHGTKLVGMITERDF